MCKVKSFVFSTLGFTSVCYSSGAFSMVGPKFVVAITKDDLHPVTNKQAATILGVMTCIAGILGTCSGSFLSKRCVDGLGLGLGLQ